MSGTKDIQRRIKSVGNTKKITGAMEMVAAAKRRRAVEAVLRTRAYADLSWTVILNLSRGIRDGGEAPHPLLSKRSSVKNVGMVLITSNRGLCGGFNTAIINRAHEFIKKEKNRKRTDYSFILIGKRGRAVRPYFGYNIAAEFSKADVISEVREVLPAAGMIIGDYLSGVYDRIILAYTDYISAAKQVPRLKQLLPVDTGVRDEYLGAVGSGGDKKEAEEEHTYDYTFEPSPAAVLDEIIPRLIEVQLFQALLESNASEHSARMAAMHQATGAAEDMVRELTLFYNKARQASITAEIAEISAGANALAES